MLVLGAASLAIGIKALTETAAPGGTTTTATPTATPTTPPTATPSPTTAAEYVKYSSAEYGFSIRYPRGWTTNENATGTAIYCDAPDRNASFNVSIPAPAQGMTLDELAAAAKGMIENMFPDITFTGERDVQVGGVEGREWTATWENFAGTGIKVVMRQDFFIVNDTVYTVTFLARPEYYDSYASTFDAILNSFTTTAPTTTTTPTPTATPKAGIPLTIDTRWGIPEAQIIVDKDGTVTYRVTPVKLMAYGGSPGVTGYTWGKPTGGRFPPAGITIDPLTGVLQGTGGPLAEPGVYYFDVEVTDGTSTATATLAIEIKEYRYEEGSFNVAPYFVFQQAFLDNIRLPNAKAGQPYGATLLVEGGKPPYWWSLRPGYADFALAGLWLDQSRGLIRGTISESMAGRTIRFAVTVTDSADNEAMCGGPHTEQGPIYEIYVEP